MVPTSCACTPSTAKLTIPAESSGPNRRTELRPESASRVGHPAPFPVALPERLIHMNTYEGELVLDPFMGSGSSGVAALQQGRRFAGNDVSDDSLKLARERLLVAGGVEGSLFTGVARSVAVQQRLALG